MASSTAGWGRTENTVDAVALFGGCRSAALRCRWIIREPGHAEYPGDFAGVATLRAVLDRYFRVSERGSTVAREIRGGLVTFVTMAYIVVLTR